MVRSTIIEYQHSLQGQILPIQVCNYYTPSINLMTPLAVNKGIVKVSCHGDQRPCKNLLNADVTLRLGPTMASFFKMNKTFHIFSIKIPSALLESTAHNFH